MTAHSLQAVPCFGCGQRMLFMDYHLPHCEPAQAKMAFLKVKPAKKQKQKETQAAPAPADKVAVPAAEFETTGGRRHRKKIRP